MFEEEKDARATRRKRKMDHKRREQDNGSRFRDTRAASRKRTKVILRQQVYN